MIPNVCTVLKLHLVISAQISYCSGRESLIACEKSCQVPQFMWDCVVDIEADPAFLVLALASGVFLVKLKNPKKYLKNLWPVTGSYYPDSGLTFWVSASIRKCCIPSSTLQPLELISTLLGRAWSLFQFKVPPRRKLGKWEKSHFYVLETCGNP